MKTPSPRPSRITPSDLERAHIHADAPALLVDLGALAENYAILKQAAHGAEVAAAVKANAYGLGAVAVAQKLFAVGCRTFLVAYASEALELRSALPDANILVLHGISDGKPKNFIAGKLIPVLNDLSTLAQWNETAAEHGKKLPAAIHFDTGMNRLGMPEDEQQRLLTEPALYSNLEVKAWLSHFACADELQHPMNGLQIVKFNALLARLPKTTACMANSAGIFLGPQACFDMVKPGIALYGSNPVPQLPNPMHNVVTLLTPVIQIHMATEGTTVGYGATHTFTRPSRIATLALGYADGYHRILSNKGIVHIDGKPAPIIGRISMDLITVDITDLPENTVQTGTLVEIFGPHHGVDKVAAEAKTIGYEILTSIGRRTRRLYI